MAIACSLTVDIMRYIKRFKKITQREDRYRHRYWHCVIFFNSFYEGRNLGKFLGSKT